MTPLAIYLTAAIVFTLAWVLIGYARGPVRTNSSFCAVSFASRRDGVGDEVDTALHAAANSRGGPQHVGR